MADAAVPGVNVCVYCKKNRDSLDRLRSSQLLDLMKTHNKHIYTRASLFCPECKAKAERKFLKAKARRLQEEKASKSNSNDKTASYSVTSRSGLNRSNNSSRTQNTSRNNSQPAGPSRNVARRTTGRPTNHAPDSQGSSNSSEASKSSSASSGNSSELAIDDPPSDFDAITQPPDQGGFSSEELPPIFEDPPFPDQVVNIPIRQNSSRSSESRSIAPLPRNRPVRTVVPTRPPTPERMSQMSSSERSLEFNSFTRGRAG